MPIYMSSEEVTAKIDAGDVETINGVMSGEIIVGEAPEGEASTVTEEVAEVHEEVQEEIPTEPQPVPEPESAQEMGIDKSEYEELLKKYEEERKAREEALRKAKEESDRIKELEERFKSISTTSISEEAKLNIELPTINEDVDDAELAGSFSKNNRLYIDSLRDGLSKAASVEQISALEAKLNQVLEIEKQRAEEQARIAATNAERARQNKMFTEVDEFAKTHEHFQMKRPTSEVFNEVNAFKSRLKEFLRTEDNREVERKYRDIVSGKDTRLIESINTVGIELPEDIEAYQKLAEIVDLKNGYQFNKYTGEYEPILDDYGAKVSQRSLEDAFKLSRFSDIIAQAKAEQSEAIQNRLDIRENSATVLSEEVTSDGSDSGAITVEEANQLLSLPNSVIMKNPALKAKFDQLFN